MRIKEITSQSRRDFDAIYECDHCGVTKKASGYDDVHYHNKVIPAMKCAECGKTAGDSYRPLAPKHADGEEV